MRWTRRHLDLRPLSRPRCRTKVSASAPAPVRRRRPCSKRSLATWVGTMSRSSRSSSPSAALAAAANVHQRRRGSGPARSPRTASRRPRPPRSRRARLTTYCRAAHARPRSYTDVPCRSRAEVVADGFNIGDIALGTDGNPVLDLWRPSGHVWCGATTGSAPETTSRSRRSTAPSAAQDSEARRTSRSTPTATRWSASETAAASATEPSTSSACVDPSCAAPNESRPQLRRRRHRPLQLDRDRNGRQPGRQLLRQPPERRPEGAALQRPPVRRERRHDRTSSRAPETSGSTPRSRSARTGTP